MKLASTYQRFYFALLCLLLVVACVAYYLSIRYVLIHQVDNDLKIEQQELLDFVQLHDSLPPPSHYRDQRLEWTLSPVIIGQRKFENTIGRERRDSHYRESDPERALLFSLTVRGKNYLITISKSLEETEDLLWLILWVTGGSFAILLVGLYIGNRFILRRIWQPFYQTLDYLGKFRLSDTGVEKGAVSTIDEFALLSRSVEDMTAKMQRDYWSLQQFTDHAAHEMQTPLAVMKTKLDLMMQHPGIDERQLEQIQQLHYSVNRLNRLNQSLLLLARIENRQYLEKEPVALKQLLEEKLDLWQEWIKQHHLALFLQLQDITALLHPFLAESLINNLLSNAVRHNIPGGEIYIVLSSEGLEVRNTGHAGPLDEERLFMRFQKQHPSEGVGLGLAIVKEIAELSGMSILYTFEPPMHVFSLSF